MVINYFQILFSAESTFGDRIWNLVRPMVSARDNNKLTKVILHEEVKTTMFQMHPDKSSCLDGLNLAFFFRNWSTLLEVIRWKVVRTSCKRDIFIPLWLIQILWLFQKLIILNVWYFIPIFLCNILYKIVLKVHANKMKSVLSNIFSEIYTAFVPSRLIFDNILISF